VSVHNDTQYGLRQKGKHIFISKNLFGGTLD